jgi:hypothetical protein
MVAAVSALLDTVKKLGVGLNGPLVIPGSGSELQLALIKAWPRIEAAVRRGERAADLAAAVRPVFDVFDPEDSNMPMDQHNVLRELFDALTAFDEEGVQ